MRTPLNRRIVTALAAALLAVGAVWALSHCGDAVSNIAGADTGGGGGTKQPCKNNAQCTGGQTCKDGFCSSGTSDDGGGTSCTKKLDCAGNEDCVGGKCVAPDEDGGGGGEDAGDGGLPNGDSDTCTDSASCGTGYRCNGQTHLCEPAGVAKIEPDTLDFGAVDFGSEVTRTLTVSNIGTLPLTVIELSFDTGTNPDAQNPRFTLVPSAATPATIKPNDKITVDVTYRQQGALADTGTLLVSTDDLDKPLARVPLTTTYKGAPDLAIVDRAKSPPEVLYPAAGSVDEYTVDLGDNAVNAAVEKTVSFVNATGGNAILSLGSMTATKKSANEFTVTFKDAVDPQKVLTPPIYLGPGDGADLVIGYHPTQKEAAEATDLEIETNDPDIANLGAGGTSTLTVKLRARAGYSAPAVSVSKASIAYGEVQVNTSADQQVKICNTGGDVLNVAATSGLEYPATDFSLNPAQLQGPLNPQDCLTVTVAFAPKSVGQANNTLIVDTDDPKAARVTVPLSGTGSNPTISVDPTDIDFGIVYVGQSAAPRTVTIKNPGNGVLKVTAIALTAGSSADYKLSNKPALPATLRDNQQDTVTFVVEFTPSNKGTILGAVQIDSTDAKAPQKTIAIKATADYSIGHACLIQSDCSGSFCVDGFCCNQQCNDKCEACNLSGKEGTCTAIVALADPDNECDKDAETTCGRNGFCSGSRGSCGYYGAETTCFQSSCAAGTQVNPRVCSGSGSCLIPIPSMTLCGSYNCNIDGKTCLTACATNADCASGFACSAGHECRQDLGQQCQADVQCATGFCADGVCCQGRCDGTCEKCNQTGRAGYCDPVSDGNDPDQECTKDPVNPCGLTGWCNGQRACGLAANNAQCAPPSCAGDVSTLPDLCDGSGNCVDKGTKSCPPYKCDTLTGLCKPLCNADGDCTTGYTCHSASHECRKADGQSCAGNAECTSGGCCGSVCTDRQTDVNNCGSCGNLCTNLHGTTTCVAAVCTPACSNGWASCDSDPDNGCEQAVDAANSCATSEDLGAKCGDANCNSPLPPVFCNNAGYQSLAIRTGTNTRWFKAHANECSDCLSNLDHRIILTVPAGANYDLCVYDSCGHSLGCATDSGTGGTEQISITKNDPGLNGDDGFDYWIEVKFISGSQCLPWTLSVDGHQSC